MPLSKEELGINNWADPKNLPAETFVCGYCGDKDSSSLGWGASSRGPKSTLIRLCPNCWGPTLFAHEGQRVPSSAPGQPVPNVPRDLHRLYNEARASTAAGAYTGAVLLCRKMLMNIAVAEGDKPGRSFVQYVEYLADKGFVPPHGRIWVDYVRRKGNEATHEIPDMTESDVVALIQFVEMLLRFIYEFPSLVPEPDPGT